MPVHPSMHYFWHGSYFCVHVLYVRLWVYECCCESCSVTKMDVTCRSLSQPGDRGGSPLKVRPCPPMTDQHQMCVCAHIHVSQREQQKRQKAGTSFISIYLFIFTQATLCINRQPHLYACVYNPFMSMCVLPSVWWGVCMINTRQAWEEFWSGALQQLLWKQHYHPNKTNGH